MFSNFTKKYIMPFKSVYCIFIGYLILVVIFRIQLMQSIAQSGYLTITLSDCLIMCTRYDFFPIAITVITSICTAIIVTNKFNINIVVHQRSKRRMWNSEALSVITISFIFAIMLIACVLIIGLFCSEGLTNFSDNNSFMRYFTKATLRTDRSFLAVVFATFVSTFLIMAIVNLVVLMSKWLFNSTVWGTLLVVTICLIGTVGSDLNFIFEKVYVDYGMWFNETAILINFAYLLIIILIIYFIGLSVSNRKEFYGEKE